MPQFDDLCAALMALSGVAFAMLAIAWFTLLPTVGLLWIIGVVK